MVVQDVTNVFKDIMAIRNANLAIVAPWGVRAQFAMQQENVLVFQIFRDGLVINAPQDIISIQNVCVSNTL